MKIVHVIHCCSAGGAEMFVKTLLISMANQQSDNTYELWSIYDAKELFHGDCVSIDFEKKYITELEENNIIVRKVSKQRGIYNRIKMLRKIKKLYKTSKPDIINTHLETVTFHVCLALLFQKITIFETIHNIVINRKKIHKYFLNHIIKKYISISETVTKSIIENISVPIKKIELIYNGIDLKKYKCNERKFDTAADSIVAIGRLTEQKNFKLLLDAYYELVKRCKTKNLSVPKLKIYGNGEQYNFLKQYIIDRGLKCAELMGITSNISNVLKDNDIYVLCSKWEGLSISLIEALTSGISIICTDVGGNSEIIDNKKTGYVIKSENQKELVNKMYDLMINKEIRKEFYKNCQKSSLKFDIKNCAEKYLKLYYGKSKNFIL